MIARLRASWNTRVSIAGVGCSELTARAVQRGLQELEWDRNPATILGSTMTGWQPEVEKKPSCICDHT